VYGGIYGPFLNMQLFWFRNSGSISNTSNMIIRIGSQISAELRPLRLRKWRLLWKKHLGSFSGPYLQWLQRRLLLLLSHSLLRLHVLRPRYLHLRQLRRLPWPSGEHLSDWSPGKLRIVDSSFKLPDDDSAISPDHLVAPPGLPGLPGNDTLPHKSMILFLLSLWCSPHKFKRV